MKAKFAIALLAIATLCASALAQENTAEDSIRKGQASYKNESFADALEAFEKATQIDPQNSEAWVGLGKALDLVAATSYSQKEQTKAYEEALLAYDKAIETAKSDHELSMAWEGRGMGLDLLGKKDESIEAYNKAVELDSKNAGAWLGKGVVLLNQAFITNNSSLNLEGEKAVDKALEIDPQDPWAWANKGSALLGQKRYDEAIKAYDKALELDPKNPQALDGKAMALETMGRHEEALEEANSTQELARIWYNRAVILRNEGKFDEALEAYNEVIDLDPKNIEARIDKGITYLVMGEFNESLAAFDDALAIDPNSSMIWREKGLVLERMGRFNESLEAYEEALRIDPANPSAWAGRGFTLKQLGRYEEALQAFDKVVEIAPTYFGTADVWFAKGEALDKLCRRDEAATAYESALLAYKKDLERSPGVPKYWGCKGDALKALGRQAEADEAYARAEELGYKAAIVVQENASEINESIPLIPREVLFGNPEQAMIYLSPDGSNISYCAPVNGVLNIWVGPTDNPKAAKPVTNDTHRGIVIYNWAYTNEHIIYLQDKDGDVNWQIYCLNLSSGKIKNLTSFEGTQAWIRTLSPKFPEEVIIELNKRDPRFTDIYRLNIISGNLTLVQKNDDGFLRLYIDDDYKVRFGTKITPDGKKEIFEKTEKGDWKLFARIEKEDDQTTNIIGFDMSGKIMYMWDSRGRNTAALYALNLETGEKTLIAEDPKADLLDYSMENILIHPKEKAVQAVAVNYERKHWQIIDPGIKDDFKYLSTVADGDFAVMSQSLDGDAWIVAYAVDDGPGGVYYYNRNKREARFLFTGFEELEDRPFAKMHPVIIKSRDGLDLVSYYTLPLNSDSDGDGIPDKPLPTVLLVHGGPEARDVWGFNSDHQWLANRGYAVLSVNFRGSTGFGKNFTNAGNLEWGRRMHDDLIDAVNWSVKKGIADPEKIAIMGGSYGGYATLVGLTFTPETFACGVDMYGPSSLVTLLENFPAWMTPTMGRLATTIGNLSTEDGQKLLAERSPLNYVDRIRRPLLVCQGANDPIVNRNESDQIVQAMQDKGLSATYVLFSDEGHYIARPENNIALYAIAEAFLSQHLGGRFEPMGADLQGSSVTVPVGAEEIPGLEMALSHNSGVNVAFNNAGEQEYETKNQSEAKASSTPKMLAIASIKAADDDEFVVVANSRTATQSLNGWTLDVSDDRNGGRNQSITLPDFTLGPDERINVHLGKGESNETDIFLNSAVTLNDTAGNVTLKDETERDVASFGYRVEADGSVTGIMTAEGEFSYPPSDQNEVKMVVREAGSGPYVTERTEYEPEASRLNISSTSATAQDNTAYGWIDKGNALAEQGNYDEAVKALDNATELSPQDKHIWMSRGLILAAHMGRYNESIEAYERAIQIDPKDADAWFGKGAALNKTGRYEEASQALNKATDLNPKLVAAWKVKGDALKALGRTSEADVANARAKELGYLE